MGGSGSGRKFYIGAKQTTDDFPSIDVRRWKRDGLLTKNHAFNWQWSRYGELAASIRVNVEKEHINLEYKHRSAQQEDWKTENYPIFLEWSVCHLGGKRPWFLCPAEGCGRRVAKLYLGRIFACRHCYQLNYPSQRESELDRTTLKIDHIRDKLQWEPGFLNGNGWKPKGMHWKTYERLTWQHQNLTQKCFADIVRIFNLGDIALKQETN